MSDCKKFRFATRQQKQVDTIQIIDCKTPKKEMTCLNNKLLGNICEYISQCVYIYYMYLLIYVQVYQVLNKYISKNFCLHATGNVTRCQTTKVFLYDKDYAIQFYLLRFVRVKFFKLGNTFVPLQKHTVFIQLSILLSIYLFIQLSI